MKTPSHGISAVSASLSCCFVAGTPVWTDKGLVPIEKIRIGDCVLSYPEDQVPPKHLRTDADEYIYRRVVQTFVHEKNEVCKLTIFNFGSNSGEILTVTPNHLFYVKHEGWIPANKLNFTCPLENAHFGNLAVGCVERIDEKARVYNLEVEEFHTYYAGELGVWVHNSCGFLSGCDAQPYGQPDRPTAALLGSLRASRSGGRLPPR